MSIITAPNLRALLDGRVPAIAVSFADLLPEEDIAEAQRDGLDVFELRIDRYTSTESEHVLDQVRRFANVATIATIRTADEGGEWAGSDKERLALFEAIIPHVGGIDIELASDGIVNQVIDAAKAHGKVVIVSNHNFEQTPPPKVLAEMAHEAKNLGADFVKLSAMANSQEDLRTLAGFTVEHQELGLIVIAMGPHGTASRVFFPALGSRLTYAFSQAWPVSGQLTFRETFRELRLFYPEFNEKKVIETGMLDGA